MTHPPHANATESPSSPPRRTLPPLLVIPAIDIKGGRCVRLTQGRPDAVTLYAEDPPATARQWAAEGASWLHVVDLDGAWQGHPVHTDLIRRVIAAAGIPVQVGGGLRTDADIDQTLRAGAARVIVGTRALDGRNALEHLARRFGDRIALALDVYEGRLCANGWVRETDRQASDVVAEAEAVGIRTLICTDTRRDGMLRGINGEWIEQVCRACKAAVIASGGIASSADISALRSLGCPNLAGVIVGKALYEGTVTLRALMAAACGQQTE